jgi:pimeloyl-ACP methyl ester carboxylesterase
MGTREPYSVFWEANRMLKRILLALGALLILLLAVAVLGPFLISRATMQPQGEARDAATPESRFLTIPFAGTAGLPIHYLERGPGDGREGPTFVLLHGFTLNSFTWGPVLDAFAARGRTIAYDQPPYGLSAKPVPGDWTGANPYDKAAAIDQLFAVMDGLGVARAILVGSSSGGTLALEAALARPERVQALVLIAPWVYAQRPTLPTWLADLPQMRRLSLLIGRKLGANTLLGLSFAEPQAITPERQELARLHARMAGWDLAWGELLNHSLTTPVDVGERLASVKQPVLLVTGERDRLVPPEDTKRVASALPRAELATLSNCGHVPHEECSNPFLEIVAPWLDRLEP